MLHLSGFFPCWYLPRDRPDGKRARLPTFSDPPAMTSSAAVPSFQPFELEYYQSQYEHDVEINLADSSVQCVSTREWLTDEEQQRLLDTPLYYPMVNGTLELRRAIAALYPNARAENVLVTVGAAQANSMVAATLLAPGDEVVVGAPGGRRGGGGARGAG